MTTRLRVLLEHPLYSSNELSESVIAILESRTELAMATLRGLESHINIAHYAYSNALDIYILSSPNTQHIRNLDVNPSVASVIWITSESGENSYRELQLFGTCERVQKLELIDALRQYSQRFKSFRKVIKHPTDFAKGLTDSRLFVIKVVSIKLIDEPRFGVASPIVIHLKR